ncbi:MAG: hypothetical protein WKF70_01740 [Chitinophagaceae bacterium]
MRKILFGCLLISFASVCHAQKMQSIQFNLYTDSLKKGFFNYINVDGQSTDGNWYPLDSTHLIFRATAGSFRGNYLFIDSSFTGDSIIVQILLRQDTSVQKNLVIYIRKRGFDEPLKTEDEILNKMPGNRRKSSRF